MAHAPLGIDDVFDMEELKKTLVESIWESAKEQVLEDASDGHEFGEVDEVDPLGRHLKAGCKAPVNEFVSMPS